jgi:hypothetical protein
MLMGRIQLSPDEEWLLRYLDKYCKSPDEGSAVWFPKATWHKPDELEEMFKPVATRMDWETLDATASSLRGYRLADRNYTSNSVYAWITGEGRQHVRSLDNPDIVAKYLMQARHHPIRARIIIFHILMGAVAGWVALILGIFNAWKLWSGD